MTYPAITADGQIHTSGGIKYTSILAQKRWKRTALVPNYGGETVLEQAIAGGAITPAKLSLALNFASTPPGSPSTGVKYLVRPTATGAWLGKENYIAEWDGSTWLFTAPREGMLAWDPAADLLYGYTGSAWVVANQYSLPGRLNAGGQLVTDWNNALEGGFYRSAAGASNVPASASTTKPVAGIVIQAADDNNLEQIVSVWDGDAAASDTYSRTRADGTWSAWVKRNLTSTEVSTLITNAITAYTANPENINFAILSASQVNPPGSPANGDRYYVPANATGAWFAQTGKIATWNATSATWTFTTLAEGMVFWVKDTDRFMAFDGTGLTIIGPQPNNQAFRFQYRLIDSVGASFGPLNSDVDYNGQPWTAVFPAANLGGGVRYYGLANNSGAGTVNANVGPEATAIRVNGENLWLFSASFTAAASPYAPGDDEPSIGF